MYDQFLSVLLGALDMISAYVMAYGGIQAARILHSGLSKAMLTAPLHFFETTPIGRVITRFSDDMLEIDLVLPFTVRSMINCVLQLTSVILIIGITTPECLLSVPPLGVLYYFSQVHVTNKTWSGVAICAHFQFFSECDCSLFVVVNYSVDRTLLFWYGMGDFKASKFNFEPPR